jgi:hypothetical protein
MFHQMGVVSTKTATRLIYLDARFAAALTIYSRVQVMWSSQSLRIVSLNSVVDIFLLALGSLPSAGAATPSAAAMAANTRAVLVR